MMFGAASANAQMEVSARLAKLEGVQQQAFGSNDENNISLSFQKVVELSKDAERESIAKSLPSIVQKMVDEQGPGATEILRGGHALNLTSDVAAGQSVLDQRSLNIQVTYDARPVGGILNVRVELIPAFEGIGSAVRPTVVRQFAQAVNDFDDDLVSNTIVQLTDELASEYAAAN